MENNTTTRRVPKFLVNLNKTKSNENAFETFLSENRKHQNEAIEAMNKSDYGQVIMPTGTGKTRVQCATHIKDMLNNTKPGTYVIAAHRLELCSQLLDSFLDLLIKCNIKFHVLFIGSLQYDFGQVREKYKHLPISVEECNSTSTTSSASILDAQKIAHKSNANLVVVSTYNSFNRLDILDSINVCTYDEAHVTIGEDFSGNLALVRPKIKKNYFFTATRRVISETEGMNNKEIYGDILYEISPREMIDAGEIVAPRVHIIDTIEEGDFHNKSMLIRTTISAFQKHKKYIKEHSANPDALGAKLLVTTNGTKEIEELVSDEDFKTYCATNNIKTISFSSNNNTGYTVDFIGQSRNVARNALKSLKDNEDSILIHCDILSEGIDLPSITGVMPYRHLNKTKLLQTIGRAARLFKDDRTALYTNTIKPNEYDKFVKPNCYVILPEHFYEEIEKNITKNTIVEVMNTYDIPVEEVCIKDKYIAVPKTELENITKKDKPNTKDCVSDLQHTVFEVLHEINIDKYLEKTCNGNMVGYQEVTTLFERLS